MIFSSFVPLWTHIGPFPVFVQADANKNRNKTWGDLFSRWKALMRERVPVYVYTWISARKIIKLYGKYFHRILSQKNCFQVFLKISNGKIWLVVTWSSCIYYHWRYWSVFEATSHKKKKKWKQSFPRTEELTQYSHPIWLYFIIWPCVVLSNHS